MSLTFELPDEIEQALRRQLGNLDQVVKEAALVELYRQGKLSHHGLSLALGIDRFETEDLLHRHNVTEDLPSAEEILADVRTIQQMREAGR